MSEHRWSWTRDVAIPSDTAAGSRLLVELVEQLRRHRWGEHDIFGVHLAVEEAVVNAIKHGNREDAAKEVRVVALVSETRLRVEITDQGEGFDPSDVPDPTDDEYIERPSGRGLMLMRSFMTTVEYSPTGNQVVLEKDRLAEN